MKILLLALSGLLLFDSSQGSTIPQEKQIRTLNTTLRTNFSGVYQRKNPCCGSEVETSLYRASHELHHHTKDDCWCDYTHKCSAIIKNFLQTIGNLIKFNNDPTGSFNFYLNTSISQKQRLTDDPNSCESLPTIVIEATDCKIPIGSGDASDEFSAQEDCSSLQSTTQNPSDWFQSEESSCKDDELKLPTTFPSSGPEVLSRGAQKPKFFKTSLKLTPQADPEKGTIQPLIHYTATNLLEEPSPQSVSESPGSLVAIPFPEGPNYAPVSPSPPLEQPPQVSPPVLESFANQNEPGRPQPEFWSSPLAEGLAQPTPTGKPYFTPAGLPPPGQFSNRPSDVFPPGDRNSFNQINDPQFSFVPQPDMAVRNDADTSTYPPFDASSKSTSQNSIPHPTTYSETQPNFLPPLRQTPQEDLRIQVSQPPVNFLPSEFNGERLNYPTNRPPTVDDLSTQSEREVLTTDFGNQLNGQPISSFPAEGGLPSTVLPPGVRGSSLTTPLPPFQYESREESKERSFDSQPFVSSLPYSNSLVTSTPGLAPIDSHSSQQPSNKRFHTSSVTTVEETVTFDEKPTTPIPGIILEQIPGNSANNFDPSSSGSNFAPYAVPQQFSSVLPDNRQQQFPPDVSRLPINPENTLKSTPGFNYMEFSTTDSQRIPNNEQVLMAETSQTVPLPVPQESQLLKPEYEPSNGLHMTTPMPYVPNSGTTTPIAPEGKLSSTTTSTTVDTYEFETPTQQRVSENQPPVGYFGHIGSSPPPASDSLVRGDLPVTGNVDGFVASTPDNRLTYDPAPVLFTDSPQQNWPPVNFEKNPPTTDSYRPEPQGSSSLPSITGRPEGYSPQPVVSTSNQRFQEEQFSARPTTELPQGMFPQGQLTGDQNWRGNPVYGATPSLSTTPVYPNQLPTEANTQQIFESQIENELREQSSKNPFDDLKQTTDSAPLRPLSQENTTPTEQFPPPNGFPGQIEAPTPASFLPQSNQVSNSPESFLMETTPGKPDFQQSSANSEQFSNFNSQPLSPVDSSKPQITTIPLTGLPSSPYWNDNTGQTAPVSSPLTVSSTAETLTTPPMDAFSTPQDAGTIPNAKYPLQTSFFAPTTPQPTFPIQSVDKSTQTTPPQPFVSFPPMSQPRNSDLIIQTPQLSFNQPLLIETNTIQPPTSLPMAEIIPTTPYPEKPRLQFAEKETTPQTFVNDDSRPQVAFDSQSVETEFSGRREESQSGDFGQKPNYEAAAGEEFVAADSPSLPHHVTRQITETTTTDVFSSDRFSTRSTEMPFLEPLPLFPESTADGEMKSTQQQSFHQTPNYADSFDPLVSQAADRSSAELQQQMQSETLPPPTVTPEPLFTYPDQPTSDNSRREVNTVVSDSVESFSSQQRPQGEVGPVHFSESQTVPQVGSNVQQRDERFPETSPPANLQPYGYYNQPRPMFNQQFPNYYNGNFPPGRYPVPNYVRNPQFYSGNYYGQQPVPQVPGSQPSPSPSNSELTVQNITETTSVSTGPEGSGSAQLAPNFSSGEQSATPGNVPYLQYPVPNYMRNPQFYSQNYPPFNGQQPMPQVPGSQPSPSPPNSELTIQNITESESTTVSTGPQTPGLAQLAPNFREESATPGNVPYPQYPLPNYMRNPQFYSQNYPQFYGQQPMPQISDSQNSPSTANSEVTVQNVTESETTSVSTGPEAPGSAQWAPNFREESATPGNVPYPQYPVPNYVRNPQFYSNNYPQFYGQQPMPQITDSQPSLSTEKSELTVQNVTETTSVSTGPEAPGSAQMAPNFSSGEQSATPGNVQYPQYPVPNYMRNPHLYSGNYPPFYGQPMPQIPGSQNSPSPPNSELNVKQVTESETTSASTGPEGQGSTQWAPNFSSGEQSATPGNITYSQYPVPNYVRNPQFYSQNYPQFYGQQPMSQIPGSQPSLSTEKSEITVQNVTESTSVSTGPEAPGSAQWAPNFREQSATPGNIPYSQYPVPNYVRNPQFYSQNYPQFYGQQPMPQIPDSQPSPSPSNSELTVQNITETTSVSTGTEGSDSAQMAPNFRVQSATPGNVQYPQYPANPNGPMMPNIPNYNAFRPDDRYRYFGHQYPVNYDPRLRFQNQQNFPPYYNFPYSYPGQRPVPPPMNQVIDERQMIGAQPGREMGVPSDGHTIRQQTEERFLKDSRPGVPIREETGSQPSENQLRNPVLQALHSQLVVPMQDNQDQGASFDTVNGSQWKPRNNLVNLQQNTALDAPRDVLQAHPHALVPHETTPSNQPDPASPGRSDSMARNRMRSGSGPEGL